MDKLSSNPKTGLKDPDYMDLKSEPQYLNKEKEQLGKAKWDAWWAKYKESGAIESMKEEWRKKAEQEREALLNSGTKKCKTCKEVKPLSQYRIRKRTRKDGSTYKSPYFQCKTCVLNYNKSYDKTPNGKASKKKSRSLRVSRNKQATPKWLTKEHKQQIVNMYELMRDCRTVTGEDYHVDHIVPLRGENICGLHVPWNLQVLPAYVNINKSNSIV
jgi:hypothetical protein